MNRPSTFPKAVQMPLRDAFRGLATVAELTEEAMEPLVHTLPDPVRAVLRNVIRKIEGAGSELIGPHVTYDDIQRAAAFIGGRSYGGGDIGLCATVLGFAWDKVRKTENFHPFLSETLASVRLSRLHKTGTPSEQATLVLRALKENHIAGRLPGVAIEPSETERKEVDLRLFSIVVWLLAERAETLEEELQLLDMALALTRAYETRVLEAMEESADLDGLLQSLSGHL